MSGTRVTTAETQEWARLYAEGWPTRWIADYARRNKATVRDALLKIGVQLRPPGPRPEWCDECCTYQYLNPRTGWCSSCTAARTGQ